MSPGGVLEILPALPLHSLIDLDKYKQRPPQCTRGHQTAAMSGIHSPLHEFTSVQDRQEEEEEAVDLYVKTKANIHHAKDLIVLIHFI